MRPRLSVAFGYNRSDYPNPDYNENFTVRELCTHLPEEFALPEPQSQQVYERLHQAMEEWVPPFVAKCVAV